MDNEAWYETLLALYKGGIINEAGLDKAIGLGWLSAEQKILIIGTVSQNRLL